MPIDVPIGYGHPSSIDRIGKVNGAVPLSPPAVPLPPPAVASEALRRQRRRAARKEAPNRRRGMSGLGQRTPGFVGPEMTIRLMLSVLDERTNAPISGVRFRVYGRTGLKPRKLKLPFLPKEIELPAVGKKLLDRTSADGTLDAKVPLYPEGWRVNLTAPGYRFTFFNVQAATAADMAAGQMSRTFFMRKRPLPKKVPAPTPVDLKITPIRKPEFPWVPVAVAGAAAILILAFTPRK